MDTTTTTAKEWFINKMDMNYFLKVFAIQTVLGNSDDYWRRGNNYYLYFDSNKLWYIPYDMDNTMTVNWTATVDPYSRPKAVPYLSDERPLIEKALEVPEFRKKYTKYLKELIEDPYFSPKESRKRILKWQNMIKDYIYSSQLEYIDTTPSFSDNPYGYHLLTEDMTNNYFAVKINTIRQYLDD